MTQDKNNGGNSLDFTYPTANGNGNSNVTQSPATTQSDPSAVPQTVPKQGQQQQNQPADNNQNSVQSVNEKAAATNVGNENQTVVKEEPALEKSKHAPGVNGNGKGSDSLNTLLDKLKKYKENLYKDEQEKNETVDSSGNNPQADESMGGQLAQSAQKVEEAAAAIENDNSNSTPASSSTPPQPAPLDSNPQASSDLPAQESYEPGSTNAKSKENVNNDQTQNSPKDSAKEQKLTEPVLIEPSEPGITSKAAATGPELTEPVQEKQSPKHKPESPQPQKGKSQPQENETKENNQKTESPTPQEQPQVLSYGDSEQEEELASDLSDEQKPNTPAQQEKVSSSGQPKYTIYQLLDIVKERDASDLHISVGYPVHIRVDGELIDVNDVEVDETYAEELILPLLDEAKRDRLEVNREVDLAYAYNDVARFRVNAFYQMKTMAAALRLIPNKIRSIEELGLPQVYYNLANLNQGLVLVTGPTGSGKSTTLASIIQEVNKTRACHIITIEDPIEYVYPEAKALVAQRELGDDTHSWKIALRSALREDPDVVLVGEMRDYETIASAITLAETGHLVFATLHTNSAAQTVDRIIDVFPEHQQNQVRSQLSNILESVIAQRLVPLQGGGRKAVSEIMLANPAVRNLIREGKTHQLDNVIRTSADIGMISMEHSLVKLVRNGEIDMETAQRFAVKPEEVVRLLKN